MPPCTSLFSHTASPYNITHHKKVFLLHRLCQNIGLPHHIFQVSHKLLRHGYITPRHPEIFLRPLKNIRKLPLFYPHKYMTQSVNPFLWDSPALLLPLLFAGGQLPPLSPLQKGKKYGRRRLCRINFHQSRSLLSK